MTVLVTGATGLAGSAIVKELTRIGKQVVGISSKDVDLLNREATFKYLSYLKPKIVINAAAKVGGISDSNNFPVEFLTENIRIQTNLMEASHEVNVERFIFLGSNCIYPKNCPQPIKEEYLLTGTLEPTSSSFSIAKLAGIELIKSYRKEFGHKWISLILSNLYGPNDNFSSENSHVLPALIYKFAKAKKLNHKSVNCWGTGLPRREFLHVDDLARAIIFCIENYDLDQQINIGTGVDLTIKELAGKISKIIGFTGQTNWDRSMVDGTSRKVLDNSNIRRLGWEPRVNLDQGIKTTIEWYLKNT